MLEQRGRIRLQLEAALRDGEIHGGSLSIHGDGHGLLTVLYGRQADVLNLTAGVGLCVWEDRPSLSLAVKLTLTPGTGVPLVVLSVNVTSVGSYRVRLAGSAYSP